MIAVVLVAITLLGGWNAPPVPPGVKQAEIQNNNLRGAGADLHAAADYREYKTRHKAARLKFLEEKTKFIWFRNYKDAAADFRKLLEEGERIEKNILHRVETNSNRIMDQCAAVRKKVAALQTLTLKINEGRLVRHGLMQAELNLAEAENLCNSGHYQKAEAGLDEANQWVAGTRKTLNQVLHRYKDETHINRWTKWIDDTVEDSRKKKALAIIVDKIHRELIVYKSGIPVKTYIIGLGPNGLSDKVHAGDNATPEGRYRVIKKHPVSQYYKALLLDYPNQENNRNFTQAKKKGLVPNRVGPGTLIEIHGGGNNFMTRGCVSLDNPDMEELFKLAAVGTPVTIVGSRGYPRDILSPLEDL